MHHSSNILLFWKISFLCALVACESPDGKERKMGLQLMESAAVPTTRLIVPLVYPVTELETLVNQKLPDIIYEDRSFDNNQEDNICLVIEKAGKIPVRMYEDDLIYTIPLRVFFQKRVIKLLGKKKSPVVENGLQFEVSLTFRSQMALSPDWRLQSETSFRSMRWREKPAIKIGFLKLSLDKLVEKKLKEKMPELLELIDQNIGQINLEKTVASIWQKIQAPILVSKQPESIWLVADPAEVWVGKIVGAEGLITIPLQLNGKLRTHMGPKPDNTPLDLPNANMLPPDSPETFDAFLSCFFPYSQLDMALGKLLVGKPIRYQDQRIVIDSIQTTGKDELLQIHLQFSGDFTGELTLLGKPVYRPEKQQIAVEAFDFETESTDLLPQMADWLLHDYLQEMVGNQLYLSVAPYTGQLPELLTRAVERGKTGEKIEVTLTDLTTSPEHIQVEEKGIEALIRLQGKGEIRLKNLHERLGE